MKALPTAVKVFDNPYQNKWKYYHPVKGHSGRDIRYKTGDTLLSPITGIVVRIAIQKQMGKVLYLKHSATGDIYVFAHLKSFLRGRGDYVKRNDEIAITDNTGSVSTQAHLHLEIITKHPVNLVDNIMTRKLWEFTGYNTDPIPYILKLYKKHNINPKTGKQSIPYPEWLRTAKKKISTLIPYRFTI